MNAKKAVALGGLALLVVAVLGWLLKVGPFAAGDDEAPIRVRNGSVIVEPYIFGNLKANKWKEAGDDGDLDPDENAEDQYRSEPGSWYPDNARQLHVKVSGSFSGCSTTTGSGRRVIVRFSDGFVFRIKRGGIWQRKSTRVLPRPGFRQQGDYILEHAGTGYIASLRVCGWNGIRCADSLSCTFQQGDRPLIDVCHEKNQKNCQ